jgi:tetratricopeptide (TPR) repeat protein
VSVVILGLGAAVLALNGDRFFSDPEASQTGHPGMQGMGHGPGQGGFPPRRPPSGDRPRKPPQGPPESPPVAPPPSPGVTPDQPGAPAQAEPSSEPPVPEALAKELNELLAQSDKAQKENRFDEAEALLVKVLDRVDSEIPKHLKVRGQVVGTLARVRFSAGKKDDALKVVDDHIEKLETSETKEPLLVAAFHELVGTYLGNSGDLENAIERFNKGLALKVMDKADPRDIASTHAKVAISYARLKKKKEAKEALGKAKELLETHKPDDQESLDKLEAIAVKYELE